MLQGHPRSLALLVMMIVVAVLAPAGVAAASTAMSRSDTVIASTGRAGTLPACAPGHVALIRAAAKRRADRIAENRSHNGVRRRALQATFIAQALRRAGCSARAARTTVTAMPAPARASAPATPGRSGSHRPVSPASPAPLSSPVNTPAAAISAAPWSSASWWTGIQGGANSWDPRVGAALGARTVRVEFAIGTAPAMMRPHVAAYADRGIRVLPLAGFHRRLPTVEEARSVAAWAREFGPGGDFWTTRPGQAQLAISHVEFGNETSYAYQGTQRRGGEYALRVRDAAEAIADAGAMVGLLVQGDDANQSDDWVGQMYAAVPDLHDYVDGWTVHPYGPRSRWEKRIDDLILATKRRGAPDTIPIDVTEWGLATDDGRCLSDNYGWDRCMTYAAAATVLTTTTAEMRTRYGGRIRHFLIYHGRDLRPSGQTGDREHYFGLATVDERDKGAFTAAARAVLAGE